MSVTAWKQSPNLRYQLYTTTPGLTQRPFLCVWCHRGITLPVWNIHASLVLMKRCILLDPTISAEKVWKWAWGRNRSSWWMLGTCVRSENQISQREYLSECRHLGTCTSTQTPTHVLYATRLTDDLQYLQSSLKSLTEKVKGPLTFYVSWDTGRVVYMPSKLGTKQMPSQTKCSGGCLLFLLWLALLSVDCSAYDLKKLAFVLMKGICETVPSVTQL